jgi:hypothetical protein
MNTDGQINVRHDWPRHGGSELGEIVRKLSSPPEKPYAELTT